MGKRCKKFAAYVLSLLFVVCFAMPANAEQLQRSEPVVTPTESQAQPETNLPQSLTNAQLPDPSTLVNKNGRSKAEKKLDNRLLQLVNSADLPPGKTKNQLIAEMRDQKQADYVKSVLAVNVYIQWNSGYNTDSIKPYLLKTKGVDSADRLMTASVDADKLTALASSAAVKSIRTIYRPVVYSGSVQSQGDSVLTAAQMRTQFGVNGSGVKIGVISDGVDHIADSQNPLYQDLPPDVHVLSNAVGGDEGTAMLEIVYDLAPGASLYFHDCGSDTIEFNAAIDALVNAGCDIIVDDIGWPGEPYFEDGPVATHIEAILSSHDIIYLSSAGNSSGNYPTYAHYQGMFYPSTNGWHDFSAGTDVNHPYLYFNIPSGGELFAILQWEEPFGHAFNDYDLYLFNIDVPSNPVRVDFSEFTQSGTQDPLEFIDYINQTQHSSTYILMIDKYGGPAQTNMLELYGYCYGGAQRQSYNMTFGDSIYGQPAAADVIACGAVYWDTPTTIEAFSSRGPVTMLTVTRNKPDVVGTDGVSVTGAGGFGSTFFGTSASAPHVAAVAALLKQRYPTENAASIRSILVNNTDDLGAAGFDNIYGFGRVDALKAAQSESYVQFDSQGGSAVGYLLAASGSIISPPAFPILYGYHFTGWFKDSDCTIPWNFSSDTVSADTVLYAGWIVNHKVTFESNGGSSLPDQTNIEYTSLITDPGTPVRTGFTFDGWYTDDNTFSNRWNFASDTMPANDVTLYAKWLQNFNVIFESNGGPDISGQTVPYTRFVTDPGNPARDGYTFYGWYTDNDSFLNAWNFSANAMPASDLTLYAKWLTNYTVSFETNGGNAISDQTVADGRLAANPGTPSRTGYVCDGWFKDADCTIPWIFSSDTVSSNTTIFAKWNVSHYRVTFDENGGVGVTDQPSVAYGTHVANPDIPTRTGYSFDGWFTSNDTPGTQWNFASDTMPAADITLYAHWSINHYDVTFVENGGSAVSDQGNVAYASHIANPGTPVLNGFTFDGWFTSNDNSGNQWNFTSATMPATNMTLYAHWSINHYNATFVENGGSTVSDQPSMAFGSLLADPGAPLLNGNIFGGWYADNGTFLNQWHFPSDTMPSHDLTLYAKWQRITATLEMKNYHALRISWNAIDLIDGYEVWRATTLTGSFQQVGGDTTALSYTDEPITTGATYYYKVRPFTLSGSDKIEKAFSNIVSGKPIWTPLLLSAVLQCYHTAALSWNGVAGADGYEIWRSTYSAGTYSPINGGVLATSYADAGLPLGKTYYYKVRAFVLNGSIKAYGSFSAYKYVTPKWPSVTLLSATLQNYHDAAISWNPVSNVDGYTVYRNTRYYGTYSEIQSGITATSYLDQGLAAGKTYYYKVRPYNLVNGLKVYGTYSGYKYVTPKWPSVTLLSATLQNYHDSAISWSPVANVDGYTVYRNTRYYGTYSEIQSGITATSYLDQGLAAGKTYYYKVRPYDLVNGLKVYGTYSRYKYVTPKWPAISLTASRNTYNSLQLNWITSASVDGYELWRRPSFSSTYVQTGGDLTANFYTDEGLLTNTTYYYKVRAFDWVNGNKVYSPFSSARYARTAWPTLSLAVSANGYDSLKLTWNSVLGADGYTVWRCNTYGGTYLQVGGDILTTQYTDYGLATGKTYYYKIKPYDETAGGRATGPPSSYRYAKVVPDIPTGLVLANESPTSIRVTYDAVAGATGYDIYRATSSAGTYSLIRSAPGLEWSDSGRATGHAYYYKVRAYTMAGTTKVTGSFTAVKSIVAQ